MLKLPALVFAITASAAYPAFAASPPLTTKDACIAFDKKSCDASRVDAFSSVDLNADGEKEILFAYDGGSCGEQHYVFSRKNGKWTRIANWCGMDGGGYAILKSRHKGFLDINTGLGILRFNGKEYPDTTKKR